jgi:hypothetical protein
VSTRTLSQVEPSPYPTIHFCKIHFNITVQTLLMPIQVQGRWLHFTAGDWRTAKQPSTLVCDSSLGVPHALGSAKNTLRAGHVCLSVYRPNRLLRCLNALSDDNGTVDRIRSETGAIVRTHCRATKIWAHISVRMATNATTLDKISATMSYNERNNESGSH